MSTTTYYPSDDNGIYVGNTWQTAHDATTGTLRGGNTRYIQSFTQNSPTIERGFFTFDTSALDDGVNITSASLVLESAGKHDSSQGITNQWDVSIFNSSHNDTIEAGDYDQAGTTLWSSKLNYSDWAASGSDVTFELNSTGIAGISKTGKTKISIREASHDAANSIHNPTINQVYVAFDDSGTAGTDSDPYLSVTYSTVSGPAKLKTLNGTLKAKIKSINGTLIAKVKSYNSIV